MSLSRAFTVSTKRARKPSDGDVSTIPQRSSTTKQSLSGAGTIREKKISAPIELISTTNMLSYNAPDIYPRGRSSTTSSTNSDGRSVASDTDTAPSSVGTPLTSPDTSSVESSPTTSSVPQPNHLSCYFNQNVVSESEAPMIPTRALSHTKKSSEVMARKRSMSRISSPKNSISIAKGGMPPAASARSSANAFTANPEAIDRHPFGKELAQVSELAEEYSSSKGKLVVDPEEQELATKGLFKFRAEDYMSELQGLFQNIFGDKPQMTTAPMWI